MSMDYDFNETRKILYDLGLYNGLSLLTSQKIDFDLKALAEYIIIERENLDIFFKSSELNNILIKMIDKKLFSNSPDEKNTVTKNIYIEILDIISTKKTIKEDFFKKIVDCYDLYVNTDKPEAEDLSIALKLLDITLENNYKLNKTKINQIKNTIKNFTTEKVDLLAYSYTQLMKYSTKVSYMDLSDLASEFMDICSDIKNEQYFMTLLEVCFKYNMSIPDDLLKEYISEALDTSNRELLSNILKNINALPDEEKTTNDIISLYSNLSIDEKAALLPSILDYYIRKLEDTDISYVKDKVLFEEINKIQELCQNMLDVIEGVSIKNNGFTVHSSLLKFFNMIDKKIKNEEYDKLINIFENRVCNNTEQVEEIEYAQNLLKYARRFSLDVNLHALRIMLCKYNKYTDETTIMCEDDLEFTSSLVNNLNSRKFEMDELDKQNIYSYLSLNIHGCNYKEYMYITEILMSLTQNSIDNNNKLLNELLELCLVDIDDSEIATEKGKMEYNTKQFEKYGLMLHYLSKGENAIAAGKYFMNDFGGKLGEYSEETKDLNL